MAALRSQYSASTLTSVRKDEKRAEHAENVVAAAHSDQKLGTQEKPVAAAQAERSRAGTSRPSADDMLRRVAVIIHQHIIHGENVMAARLERWTGEDGAFPISHASPAFGAARAPVLRGGGEWDEEDEDRVRQSGKSRQNARLYPRSEVTEIVCCGGDRSEESGEGDGARVEDEGPLSLRLGTPLLRGLSSSGSSVGRGRRRTGDGSGGKESGRFVICDWIWKDLCGCGGRRSSGDGDGVGDEGESHGDGDLDGDGVLSRHDLLLAAAASAPSPIRSLHRIPSDPGSVILGRANAQEMDARVAELDRAAREREEEYGRGRGGGGGGGDYDDDSEDESSVDFGSEEGSSDDEDEADGDGGGWESDGSWSAGESPDAAARRLDRERERRWGPRDPFAHVPHSTLAFHEREFDVPIFRYSLSSMSSVVSGSVSTVRRVRRSYPMPTPEHIMELARHVYKQAQLSAETIVSALVYIERLMQAGPVYLLACTWRPVLIAGLLLSSKVWQDLNTWNGEMADVCAEWPLRGINRLERRFVGTLRFQLYIPSELYAKYFFALRAMKEEGNFRSRFAGFVRAATRAPAAERRAVEARTRLLPGMMGKEEGE